MVWYHKGNVKPEEEWPTDEYWREHWSNLHGSEEEPDPGSFSDSAWVLPGNVTDQDWLSRLPETKETYTCQNWLARPVRPLKEILQIFSVRKVNT